MGERMKEQFRTQKFYKKSMDKLVQIDTILTEYKKKDIRITLRQLYYQLVQEDLYQTNPMNIITYRF